MLDIIYLVIINKAAPILRRRAEYGGWTSCALPCAFCPVLTPYTRPPASGSPMRLF